MRGMIITAQRPAGSVGGKTVDSSVWMNPKPVTSCTSANRDPRTKEKHKRVKQFCLTSSTGMKELGPLLNCLGIFIPLSWERKEGMEVKHSHFAHTLDCQDFKLKSSPPLPDCREGISQGRYLTKQVGSNRLKQEKEPRAKLL